MKLVIEESPKCQSFTLGGTSTFKQDIISDNSVDIIVSYHTKTQLYMNMSKGQTRYSINYISSYAKENNLTFISKNHVNYLSGTIEIHNYFKLTKKQNIDVLTKHVISLTEDIIDNTLHIGSIINKDTFVIKMYLPSDLMPVKLC